MADAKDAVVAELGEVLRMFSSLDEHLNSIEDISREVERRLRIRVLPNVSVTSRHSAM